MSAAPAWRAILHFGGVGASTEGCHLAHKLSDGHSIDEPTIPGDLPFRDSGSAASSLNKVRQKLLPSAYGTLLRMLTESADPDVAVMLLARYLERCASDPAAGSVANIQALYYACLVFAHSSWLAETVIREPDCLLSLVPGRKLELCWSRDDYRDQFAHFKMRSKMDDVGCLLARFRKREYVRILLRDVLEIAPVGEVTQEISALSDALLEEAVLAVQAELREQWLTAGRSHSLSRKLTSRFAAVSLGKLGGNELNYSSDVDLLYLYDLAEERRDTRTSEREYFVQVAQRTTELLSRPTHEGRVFRIDLRLRPQGNDGDVAVALPNALRYYSETAEDWELQAMIKARHSAGDASLSREFIQGIAAFVYRPDVNFAAVKTALQSRERIDRRGRSRPRIETSGRGINVKLDRGGIRDIEFLVQCLQRTYGGKERWLRSQGTLAALQKLHDKKHVSSKEFHTLSKAYEFLRLVEHRLQLRLGLQTHKLPTDADELRVLARRVFQHSREPDAELDICECVRSQMTTVATIYQRVIYREQSSEADGRFEHPSLASGATFPVVASRGFMANDTSGEAEKIWAGISRGEIPVHAHRRLERFLSSAGSRLEGELGLPVAESMAPTLPLFEYSEYLSELLIRHPHDVNELRTEEQVSGVEGGAKQGDRWQAAKALRQHFRRKVLAANAKDLGGSQDIWGLLALNSTAADWAIGSALSASGAPSGLAVLALGRLGSHEFDVLSDADLLFVSDEGANESDCRRAAEESVEMLAAYTQEGTVFPVDARLRPHGGEGELVTTPLRLAAYFLHDARPWEAITYLRLRWVAGNREVAERALQRVRAGCAQIAQAPDFAAGLNEMRARLEASDAEPNLKVGSGGTYDLDFLAGNLQCRHSQWCGGNLAQRIGLLKDNGLIQPDDARELSSNAEFLRRLDHCIRIVTGRSYKWLPPGDLARNLVAKLMDGGAGRRKPGILEEKLASVLRCNRAIYVKYPF